MDTEALVKRYLPKGCKVKWRSDGELRPAWITPAAGGYEMLSPYPDTPLKSLTFLHECAHAAQGEWRHDLPSHVYEYQAEQTAMRWWRNEGQRVPRAYLALAKKYIRECIATDRKAGIKILPRIAQWSKS